MNNAELDRLLKAAQPPEQSAEFWEQLLKRIQAKRHWESRRNENINLPSRPRAGVVWGWGFAGAAVLILVGFLAGNWYGKNDATALLQNEKLLREVLATFPNQVQAIIQDETGLHLALAETANVPQSQPLWLKICEGGICRTIVTFSGQMVQIADQPVEVLADPQGGVMLVGDHFFWSSEQGAIGEQARIQARQLGSLL